MSAADLRDLSEALGIEPGKLAAAVAVVRLAVREEVRAEIRSAAADHGTTRYEGASTLSLDDVVERVPWSRKTVAKMRDEGRIPMVKVGGRWTISERAFAEAQARGFPLATTRARSRPSRSARAS